MINYYWNSEHPLLPYTHQLTATPNTIPPDNATRDQEPIVIKGKWPCWDISKSDWVQIEDHRKREDMQDLVAMFGKGYQQEATKYWLPEDTHDTSARTMKEIGKLPKGALLERPAEPEPTTEQIAEQVRAERDAKIEAVRWRIERAKDELELGIPLTEPLEPLLQYVQSLRDMPQQAGFPEAISWPVLSE